MTKMGSIAGHRLDYNGVGVLRGQRHIPSKTWPKYPPPVSRQAAIFQNAVLIMMFICKWIHDRFDFACRGHPSSLLVNICSALAVYLEVLEKSCFLSRYLSWEILLFLLTYPWKLSTVNLPREMAVTHVLVFYHGKRLCPGEGGTSG